MNHKYIDKNTFEFVDNVFEVDEDIANTISILNKKGYHTLYCCSGHVKDSRIYEKYPAQKVDIDYDSYKIDDKYILVPPLDTTVYILFVEDYDFSNLPVGFTRDKNYIEKVIEYYEAGNKKTNSDILKEIKDSNHDLLEWAKSLPSRN